MSNLNIWNGLEKNISEMLWTSEVVICQYLSPHCPGSEVACHVHELALSEFQVGLQICLFSSTASFPLPPVPSCLAHRRADFHAKGGELRAVTSGGFPATVVCFQDQPDGLLCASPSLQEYMLQGSNPQLRRCLTHRHQPLKSHLLAQLVWLSG